MSTMIIHIDMYINYWINHILRNCGYIQNFFPAFFPLVFFNRFCCWEMFLHIPDEGSSFVALLSYFAGATSQHECVLDSTTAKAGSTIRTLLHGKINPKDWQVASPLVMQGFSIFFKGLFQVIMANPVSPNHRIFVIESQQIRPGK